MNSNASEIRRTAKERILRTSVGVFCSVAYVMNTTVNVTVQESMKAGGLQYGSCPQLEKRAPEEPVDDRAVRHLTIKYDSYHGLLVQQQNRRRVSSLDGSETATDVSSSSSSSAAEERLQVTDQERQQVETFFRGLKTQVLPVVTILIFLGGRRQMRTELC
jgi:hypothetical protein